MTSSHGSGNLTFGMGGVLYKVLGVAIIGASFGVSWFMMDYHAFLNQPLHVEASEVRLSIPPGGTLRTVASELASRGLLDHPNYLVWLARWHKLSHRIQAGEYAIAPGITPKQFLDRLVSGRVVQHTLTLLEGWTFRQMMNAIRNHEALVHTLGDATPTQIMARLGRPDEHPEGRFFAETYHFPWHTSDLAFLKRAYRAMQRHLDAEWAQRSPGLPFKSPYEALILASIVEKETALTDEQPAIAGVFVRRLQRNMRLQADPTVIYGLGEAFDGNIRRRDLKRDTPYNTYLHRGLPPTPIAMPGLASIRAVLHPADGKCLYFVARGDGSHVFSETLKAHNQAVRKYQTNRKHGS